VGSEEIGPVERGGGHGFNSKKHSRSRGQNGENTYIKAKGVLAKEGGNPNSKKKTGGHRAEKALKLKERIRAPVSTNGQGKRGAGKKKASSADQSLAVSQKIKNWGELQGGRETQAMNCQTKEGG